jgi:hypothetical protein
MQILKIVKHLLKNGYKEILIKDGNIYTTWGQNILSIFDDQLNYKFLSFGETETLKRSLETREKIRESMKGKTNAKGHTFSHTPETKKNISEASKKMWAKRKLINTLPT